MGIPSIAGPAQEATQGQVIADIGLEFIGIGDIGLVELDLHRNLGAGRHCRPLGLHFQFSKIYIESWGHMVLILVHLPDWQSGSRSGGPARYD